MDCGIVIKDIGVRDSGGWTCRVTARVAGKPQVSADIVRLFVGDVSFQIYVSIIMVLGRFCLCKLQNRKNASVCEKIMHIYKFFLIP